MSKDQSSNYVTIRAFEIELDTPLPWTVYDNSGNILLRKGFVITSERQRNALAARGIRRFAGTQRPSSAPTAADEESFDARNKFTVFEIIETLLSRLEQNYRLLNGPERELFPFKMAQFAIDIQLICHENPDAVLGAMQVDNESPYGLIHPLHVAVLCELVGRRMGMSQMQRLTLVAAAASHDIGISELQTLHRQTTPLTEDQWDNIRKHPTRGHDMLRDAGIHDRMWLDTVLNHHERIDGSGYPNGIKNDQIANPARLMAIADMYAAMIRPRAYRHAILAKDALRQLFEERGATVDAKLAQMFISEVGIFPPGAYVRLRNQEIAIVKDRGEDAAYPELFSIVSNKDRPYSIPIPRDPHEHEFGITEMVSPEEYAWANVKLDDFWPRMRPISLK